MLPIISGIKTTKINILVYSIILLPFAISPYLLGYNGLFYLTITLTISLYYVYLCFKLLREKNKNLEEKLAKKIFGYSILYLFLVFSTVLIDRII